MAPEFEVLLDEIQLSTWYLAIRITCQTLIYGVYFCLVPIVVHAMVTNSTNGLRSRTQKWLLAFTTSMFALSTLYWIVSVVFTFLLFDSFNNNIITCFGSDNAFGCFGREIVGTEMGISAASWQSMFDDILLVNYIFADGILVWRAWVLCSDQSRVVLMIPVVMLGMNTVIYLITLTSQAILLVFVGRFQSFVLLTNMMNITQVANLVFSLLINIFATSIIAIKAWKYRKLLMESGLGVRTPRQGIRILGLLVESGVIYILILIVVTTLACIPMFQVCLSFKLQAIFTQFWPVGVQLTGIFPVIVVLLVEKNRSLSSTYYSFGTIIASGALEGRPSQTEPTTFAPGPVAASGGQINLTTKLPNTDVHATFDFMLEPNDAVMGAASSKDPNPSEEHTVS